MTASEFFMRGYNPFQVTKKAVFKEETTTSSLLTSRETPAINKTQCAQAHKFTVLQNLTCNTSVLLAVHCHRSIHGAGSGQKPG